MAVLPRAVFAQASTKVYRIGILRGRTPDNVRVWDGFLADLKKYGYNEGGNLVIAVREFDSATTEPDLRAAELVGLGVDVIVTGATPAPEAAKRASSSIPIVMTSHPDPVASGLVASLARPGGNLTGLTTLNAELRGKQLELLRELVPRLGRVAVLMNREIPAHELELNAIRAAGEPSHIAVLAVQARSVSEFEAAFTSATRERVDGMVALSGALFFANRHALAEQAARSRIPTVYGAREFAEAGGLISYGPSLPESYRKAAWYVDRVLKGARPQDLAIQGPQQFEAVVNMKAARALGLVVPPAVLVRAERID
jgi:putative ABC transport system substrate-binding protein